MLMPSKASDHIEVSTMIFDRPSSPAHGHRTFRKCVGMQTQERLTRHLVMPTLYYYSLIPFQKSSISSKISFHDILGDPQIKGT